MDSATLLRSYLEILSEKGGKVGGTPIGAAPKPGQPADLAQTQKVQQKTQQGLRSISKPLTGQNPTAVGQAVKGFDKISQGAAVTGTQSAALEPYIEPLQMILANPQLKPRFLALVTQAKQSVTKADPTALTTPESQ
jgi:hypothetical protein